MLYCGRARVFPYPSVDIENLPWVNSSGSYEKALGDRSTRLALGLADTDPEVRIGAAAALAKFDQSAATQALIAALHREADPDVRDEIVASLEMLDVDVEAAN